MYKQFHVLGEGTNENQVYPRGSDLVSGNGKTSSMAEVELKLLDHESKFNPTLAMNLFTNSFKIASWI